jgi:hypothetical protein
MPQTGQFLRTQGCVFATTALGIQTSIRAPVLPQVLFMMCSVGIMARVLLLCLWILALGTCFQGHHCCCWCALAWASLCQEHVPYSRGPRGRDTPRASPHTLLHTLFAPPDVFSSLSVLSSILCISFWSFCGWFQGTKPRSWQNQMTPNKSISLFISISFSSLPPSCLPPYLLPSFLPPSLLLSSLPPFLCLSLILIVLFLTFYTILMSPLKNISFISHSSLHFWGRFSSCAPSLVSML